MANIVWRTEIGFFFFSKFPCRFPNGQYPGKNSENENIYAITAVSSIIDFIILYITSTNIMYNISILINQKTKNSKMSNHSKIARTYRKLYLPRLGYIFHICSPIIMRTTTKIKKKMTSPMRQFDPKC